MPRRLQRRPGPQRPRRRVRLDNDQRRAQILEIARRAFSVTPYDAFSIDDLARRAGISKGLLYHYFPTKRDLYVACLSAAGDELVASVSTISLDLAPIERTRVGLDAFLDHVENNKPAFVSLMRGGQGMDPQVTDVIESVRARLVDKFVTNTPFAPVLEHNDVFRIAIRGYLGFVEAATLDWCVAPRIPRLELRELLVALQFETVRIALGSSAQLGVPRP